MLKSAIGFQEVGAMSLLKFCSIRPVSVFTYRNKENEKSHVVIRTFHAQVFRHALNSRVAFDYQLKSLEGPRVCMIKACIG